MELGDTVVTYFAEDENGEQVQFDTCPSHSDILNCCEHLGDEIAVSVVTSTVMDIEPYFTVTRHDEG